MLKSVLLAGAATALALGASPSTAQDRYATRPPVVVSPDLSAPWVMQLRDNRPPVAAKLQRPREGALQLFGEPAPREVRRVRQPRPESVRTAAMEPRPARQAQPQVDPKYLPQQVDYDGGQKPGTIVIDTRENFLYLVEQDGKARRYGVGTGKPGFEWAGTHKVTSKREWPDWRPPAEMIKRERAKGRHLPTHMAGGPENPLGARALYLGSTLYRIHGTNQPWTIGRAVSSGCIRMRNEDVVDLYERVSVGTRVVVM
jgi:lipoprotein-anchoring transpeptidase ErfK/SrfK